MNKTVRVMNPIWKGSPNFTAGRGGKKPELVVMHWIVGTLASADATFAKSSRQASAHYGVGPNAVHQYVKEQDTAWHAGVWDINQRSIGIEHEGGPSIPITDGTYENSAQLIADIWRRYGKLPLRKHSEFKATQCCGTLDIARIERRANEILNPPPPVDSSKDQRISELEKQVKILKKQADDLSARLRDEEADVGILEGKLRACESLVREPITNTVEVIKETTKEVEVEVEPPWLTKIKELLFNWRKK